MLSCVYFRICVYIYVTKKKNKSHVCARVGVSYVKVYVDYAGGHVWCVSYIYKVFTSLIMISIRIIIIHSHRAKSRNMLIKIHSHQVPQGCLVLKKSFSLTSK